MAYRRNKKKSVKTRSVPSHSLPLKKASSVPSERQTVDWPGEIEDKHVEDVKGRLNVIEQNNVSDDMIRAFLAAHDHRKPHAAEALKKTVEWRKGQQTFWNNYRTQNERYQFLQQIRKCGKGIGSTYGHTKNGRLVFYEKLGENFSIPLHKEFSVSEFINHVIVWCENLLNAGYANAGKSIHLIHEIPYYQGEQEDSQDEGDHENNENNEEDNKIDHDDDDDVPITPNHSDYADDDDDDTFPTFPAVNNHSYKPDIQDNNHRYKQRFKQIEIENKCRFSDVVGIIDWHGLNEEIFIANKEILIASAQLLSTHYPHLINRLYHINMPPIFEKIESILKPAISSQILYKSIFLESTQTKQKRMDYMKKYGRKASIKSRSRLKNRYKNKNNKDVEESIISIGPSIDEYASSELLTEISGSLLPVEYGGSCESNNIFTFVDGLYRDLVGMSSEPEPDIISNGAGLHNQYQEYEYVKNEELKLWKQNPLRSSERLPVRIQVKRGEHYSWQYSAQYDSELYFGCTFETEGYRAKSIKIIVREEIKQKCGYYPMFGDFIVLKDGNLIFQFRNVKGKGAKRLNLQYKITKKEFPKYFINKHLPDYHAEERLLQTKTLTIGGKKKNFSRGKTTRSPSEYSGSTAISTSPPPDMLHSLLITTASNESQKQLHDDTYYKDKIKRAKSQRNKKSTKKKKKSKRKSKSKRAKTPEPHTPI